MDLSVSPDVEAYFCYLVVLLLGAWTAVVQINRGLGNLSGVWLIPRTWFLFLLYLFVPVGLFWFLDRTGAITDTSIFAAALIGVGYERIMNGTSQAIPAAVSLSQFWTPFQAYANDVQKSVLQRTKRNEDRLFDRLVSSVIADNTRYGALEALAVRFSSDANGLRAKLAAIDAKAPAAPAPPPEAPAAGAQASQDVQRKELLEDKTRLLFTELVKVPDVFYLLKQRKIITNWVYWWDVKGLRRGAGYLLALAAVATILFGLRSTIEIYLRDVPTNYYIWRLVKTNSTSLEQNRARTNLLMLMRDNAGATEIATLNMAQALRQPGLPVERIDLLLQTLLESRRAPLGNATLPKELTSSLRSASVDARTRINDVLKHLAAVCTVKFDEKDQVWKPSDGDVTVSLENHIKAWAEYWEKPCGKTI